LGENRKSGRDNFQVKITKVGGDEATVPTEIIDKDDG
jgi:hypothetical protein